VPGFAADEDPAHRAAIADPHVETAALPLRRGQIGQIRAMAFTRMDDEHVGGARRRQHAPGRLDRPAQHPDIVAERRAEAAGLEKVALHIDDPQRAAPGPQLEGIRFGRNARHPPRLAPAMTTRPAFRRPEPTQVPRQGDANEALR
jgi:hypothetical protein